jgi:flagellin
MVDRLNNSTGVLSALKSLQSSTRDLAETDKRLSSGLRVNSARDDVTAYHSAAIMKAQGSSLNAVTLSLGRAESISDTAIGAAEHISKLLVEMQDSVVAAMNEDLTADQRQAYMSRFADQKKQIEAFVHNASFDDSNILDGSKPYGVSFIADSDASVTLTLEGRNFLPGFGIVTLEADNERRRDQENPRRVDQECRRTARRDGGRAQTHRGADGLRLEACRCAGRRRRPDGGR